VYLETVHFILYSLRKNNKYYLNAVACVLKVRLLQAVPDAEQLSVI
jgi:hypothetical protein